MQIISTFHQTSNLEENMYLPGPDITLYQQGDTFVKASISNAIKDETNELNGNLHAENPIAETEIGDKHNLDNDITKVEEVIKENMKNDDSGFKEEYEVGRAKYIFFVFKNMILISSRHTFFIYLFLWSHQI